MEAFLALIRYNARLKITDSRSPVMMTDQIFLARTNPNFGRSTNTIIFFAYGISNYAGNRSLYCIDVQVFERQCLKFPSLVLHLHIGETWSFSLPGTWSKVILFVARHVIESHLHKEELSLNIYGKEVDLTRNLFHKQRICHQKSTNMQQSFRLGRRATLYHEGLINVNRNLDKDVYKKENFKLEIRDVRSWLA